MDKPDVLVHIGTAATRANDDLYQSLADAYLAFEPYKTQKGAKNEGTLPHLGTKESMHHSSSQRPTSQRDTTLPAMTSMDSYGSFPSHFTSGDRSNDPDASENSEAPASQEDGCTSRLEHLERIQARWREQRTPRSSFAESRRRSLSVSVLSYDYSAFIEDPQEALGAMESQLDFSATSEESSDDETNEDTETEATRPDFMPSPANRLNEAHLDNGDRLHGELPFAHKSLHVVAIEKKSSASSSQHSRIYVDMHNNEFSRKDAPIYPSQYVTFDQLPLVVSPPPPKVSVQSPSRLPSQVTKYLEILKKQNPNRFKPKMTPRTLEADERGHWRVDCRLWPKNVQHRFWSSLQMDISGGRLGWGVTLHREAARSRGLGLVRLYCWGEIVEHVWLSLWLHSEGRILSTGAVWLDSDEAEVISMP